ncbi:hypothetical protein EPN54_00445 [bacterium]|nr:MAG: hypothetical protein EPN54_00445 [bacterium]
MGKVKEAEKRNQEAERHEASERIMRPERKLHEAEKKRWEDEYWERQEKRGLAMKKALIVSAVVIISILAIGILKDQIIKSVITIAATEVTGAPVHIDGFSLGVFNQSVRISGFKMYNPKGFPRGTLVYLSKINVTYDLRALLKKKLHLPSAEIELKEMGLIKNAQGQLNVNELKVMKRGEQKEAGPSKQMPMQIGILKLGIGKIVSKDYSSGKEPLVYVYDVNIHKTYKNITSIQELAALIMIEPMKAAGIQGAQIYGVAMAAGMAVLPVGIAATFAGKDSAQQEFTSSLENAYDASLAVLKRKGRVTENRPAGIITGGVDSANVKIQIKKKAVDKIEIIVSARKYLFPQPKIAGGVLYEIAEKLK